jgi:hypothetical protein
MQQFLKTPPGAAGAGVVAAEFLDQLFVAMDDPLAALDARFGWIAFAAFAAHFKSSGPCFVCS